jgi:hypothetical protein
LILLHGKGLASSNVEESYPGCIGGGRIPTFSFEELQSHVECPVSDHVPMSSFKFVQHSHKNVAEALYRNSTEHVIGNVPLNFLASRLTVKDIKSIAKSHGIYTPSRLRAAEGPELFKDHHCSRCNTHLSVFVLHAVKSTSERFKKWYGDLDAEKKSELTDKIKIIKALPEAKTKAAKAAKNKRQKRRKENENECHPFPPLPPSPELVETVIGNWCKDTLPQNFEESGCAVCGQLTPIIKLGKLSNTECDLTILSRGDMGMTRLERLLPGDAIQEMKGPVLDSSCQNVCVTCEQSLLNGVTPKYALANGFWLGAVPLQLKNLSFAEKLLISRVRRNNCIVRVSSGMKKMKANAILFENPMPKIYQRLPPPVEELDEVLAFMYIGPCMPTEEDMKRTPLLVRRRKISEALEWLKLNHADYYDLDIAYDNLELYPENGPPVLVTYQSAVANRRSRSGECI